LRRQAWSSAGRADRGLATLSLGRGLLMAGQLEHARAVLLDAIADLRQANPGCSYGWGLVLLSQTDALAGRVGAAQQWRDEAREVRACWVARQAADVAAADVWMAVLHGDLATARGLALTAADQFPDLLLPRAALLHLASRLGDRSRGLVVALRKI